MSGKAPRGRKMVTMVVTLHVPAWLTAVDARREVRSLIRHGCVFERRNPADGWPVDLTDLRCRSVAALPRHD